MSLRSLPGADDDVKDAARWYNRQRRGLGLAFTRAVAAAYRTIGRQPRSFPPSPVAVPNHEVRRFVMQGYPYNTTFITACCRAEMFWSLPWRITDGSSPTGLTA